MSELSGTAIPFIPRYNTAQRHRGSAPPGLLVSSSGSNGANAPMSVDALRPANRPPAEWIQMASTIALANPLGGLQAASRQSSPALFMAVPIN